MITKLIFLLAESFRALFRAKLPAAISSITIAITLVIFSLAYFTYVNLLGYSYKFKSKYRIEVFFQSDLNTNEARDLFNTILISDGIEQGEFINKEKAADLFKLYFHEDIIDIIGENPAPIKPCIMPSATKGNRIKLLVAPNKCMVSMASCLA